MIRLTSLSCCYGKKAKPVLHDVSFALNKGEIAILLGPNGAGKSTLLQAVLGNIKFYKGDIIIDGKNIKELSVRERAKLIAYVPQSFHFAPSSVYDAILLGRIPYFTFAPSPEDHAYVHQIIQEMGLETLASRNVTELSGGEKQKVAIAEILKKEGFVNDFSVSEEKGKKTLNIVLKYSASGERVITNLKRVSKPGLRVYAQADKIPSVLKGLGIAIVSTPNGLLTDKQARKAGVGGEILAYVW